MVKTKKPQAFLKPPQPNLIPISSKSIEELKHFLLQQSGHEEMGVYFVDKEKIADLHAQFFDDPTPTDCITFPYDDPHILGEIFICPEVAQEYIDQHGGSLYEEITLYVVHGFCHLQGLDDQKPEEQEEMRRAEKRWMGELAQRGLYLSP